MNKPRWEDAPEWARWLACDGYGRWMFFEEKPEAIGTSQYARTGRISIMGNHDWRESLESRPADRGPAIKMRTEMADKQYCDVCWSDVSEVTPHQVNAPLAGAPLAQRTMNMCHICYVTHGTECLRYERSGDAQVLIRHISQVGNILRELILEQRMHHVPPKTMTQIKPPATAMPSNGMDMG